MPLFVYLPLPLPAVILAPAGATSHRKDYAWHVVGLLTGTLLGRSVDLIWTLRLQTDFDPRRLLYGLGPVGLCAVVDAVDGFSMSACCM